MTSISETFVAQRATTDDVRRLLPVRQELKLHTAPRNEDGSPAWSLHDPARQAFYRIGWMEFVMLSNWRSGLSFTELCERVNSNSSLRIDEDDVNDFQIFLLENQLLHVSDEKYTEHLLRLSRARKLNVFKQLLNQYLFFRIPLVRPDRFLGRTVHLVEKLVSTPFIVSLLIAFISGLFLISRQWESFQKTFLYFFSWQGLFWYGVTLALVKVAHELGHAYTAKHYKLHVPTMGLAFLVMWPVLYTDTTDAWKLASRRARLNIVAAGMLTELALAAIATLLWSFLPDGPLRSAAFMVATVSWVMTLLINLNPFMRFDGYYLLSDFLETPNLQERAFAQGRWWLREKLFALGDAAPEWFTPSRQRLLIVYALGVWIYRFSLFLGIAVLVYYLFFKPLGLFLMLVEIGVFLARPIVNEMRVWYGLRKRLHWNHATRRSSVILVILLILLAIPWQQHVERMAVMRPTAYTQLYSPESARIKQILVRRGEKIHKGQPLFELESPELEADYLQAAIQVRTLQWQLARNKAVENLIEYGELTEQKLAEAIAKLHSFETRRKALTLLAPFDGEVLEIDDALQAGRWLNKRQSLAQLGNVSSVVIETYVPEDVITRLRNEGARFYPFADVLEPIDATVALVDRASSTSLDSPWLASLYGGDVAVTQEPDGTLSSHEAVYRVILKVKTDMPALPSVLRGEVQIPVGAESLLFKAWQSSVAVLLRESGF